MSQINLLPRTHKLIHKEATYGERKKTTKNLRFDWGNIETRSIKRRTHTEIKVC